MATVTFKWNRRQTVERVYGASSRTITRIGDQAHIWWVAVVPIGKNTKTHRAGQLRDSWFTDTVNGRSYIGILFGASAPYAIYVELGTGKMPPQAPVRTVAGEVFPFILPFLSQELAS
jgi:hypothetical protein